MCQVCELEGRDWKFDNGENSELTKVRLYRVYKGKIAVIELCHLHAIELFLLGEQRFLLNHVKLYMDLGQDRKKYSAAA